MLLKRILVATLIAVTLSCVTVDSEADLTYKDRVITKTLNVAYFHKKRGLFGKEDKDFYNDFSAEFDRLLNSSYKLSSKTVVENSYKFNSFNITKEVEEYDPDTVIEIIQGDTVVDQLNVELSTAYIIKIYDAYSGTVIWQSEIEDEFPSTSPDGLAKKLVDIVVTHQREDGLDLFNESYSAGSAEITETSKEIIDSDMEMVFVEAGSFKKGKQEVTLTKDFYIGKYEVTQELYKEVMGKKSGKYKGDEKPAGNISWFDAIKFCNRLSIKNGKTPVYDIFGEDVRVVDDANGYRLPTESEWVYAAMGGHHSKGFKFSGSNKLKDIANSGSSVAYDVGSKDPNELGIFDMSGNVWEWCYDQNILDRSKKVTDPVGVEGPKRILKGGSYYSDEPKYLLFSHTRDEFPSKNLEHFGFRVITYDLPMTEEDVEDIKSLSTDSVVEHEAI